MRLMKLCLGSLVLIALDQLSKLWIVTHIGLGQVKSFLPGLVSLTYLQNRGAAFSILQNQSLRFYEFCHFQCCRFLSIDWCCAFDDYPLERRVRWNLL